MPSLSRAEPDYLTYLPHKDRPFGEVRLEVEEDDGSVRTGDIKVTTSGITGAPILAETDASFFSERSYLAQSTLGRLLEIYQHAVTRSESPLTRFVKELLGLDRMEAVIGGLYSAGNIARLRGPVPGYGAVRDDIPVKEKTLQALKDQEAEIAIRIATSHTQLRDCLATIDPGLINARTELSELARLLALDHEETELVDLVRARRELKVWEASWGQTNAIPGAADRAGIESANQIARAAFNDWMQQSGDRFEALLARTAALFADIAMSRESSYADRARSLAERVLVDLKRVRAVLDAREKALKERNELTRQVEEARTRVGRLDEQISAAAEANESLARTLSELNTHIHNSICPVCDRDFSETGGTPLAAHVAAKVSAMIEQAGRLQFLSRDRSTTNAAVLQLERQIEASTIQLLGDAELNQLKARAADLEEVVRQ